MKAIFLGTNGWYDTDTGNTICTLIKTKTCNIILDAGFGIAKADKYINKHKPTYIFLSHLHLDHTVGLHTLAKFQLPKGIILYTPKGSLKTLRCFIEQPFTIPPQKLPFPMNIRVATRKFRCSNLKVITRQLIHSSRCIGYRLEIEKRIIAYCTDTGMCKNALFLARNADLLITECALRDGQDDQGWPHLDPTQAATMAEISSAKQLVMTHFDAYNYSSKKERFLAQKQARKVFGKSSAAFDGMLIRI